MSGDQETRKTSCVILANAWDGGGDGNGHLKLSVYRQQSSCLLCHTCLSYDGGGDDDDYVDDNDGDDCWADCDDDGDDKCWSAAIKVAKWTAGPSDQ